MDNNENKIKKIQGRRNQTLGEEIGNAVTHGVGFLMGIAAIVLLLIKSNTPNKMIGAVLFGFGIMMLYLMSCLYHSFKRGTTVKRVFRRFDHLSIFYLIGGTFAPLLLVVVDSTFGYVFFGIQWAIIIFGTVFKSIWPTRFLPITTMIYLALGWSAVMFLPQLLSYNVGLFCLVLSGGIAYSIGVAFYALFKFKYAHFVWHFFCMAGTILHFLGIYFFVYC